MAMPAAFRAVPEDHQASQRENPSPDSLRKYAIGQKARVKIRNGEWRNGHIVGFGIQDLLPLYWVKIDGTVEHALAFEFELSSGDHD